MKEFNYLNLNHFLLDQEIYNLIIAIYKEVGKYQSYEKIHLKELNKLINYTLFQSTITSNEIEGIRTTSTRINQLFSNKIFPKNKNEEEILGYKEVLEIINNSYDVIPINKNHILQLHQLLYKYTNVSYKGKIKNVQNYISRTSNNITEVIFSTLDSYEANIALEEICLRYNETIFIKNFEPLILIPSFIHDFLCIHPFNDGNGRISRLLTTLLLYKHKFMIAKYISIENLINNTKDNYYQSLYLSQHHWYENKEDKSHFIKYFLKILLTAYKELNKKQEFNKKDNAYEIVLKVINNFIGKFKKDDVVKNCLNLSLSSIENSLRKLAKNNVIKKEGKGKNTYYFKIE